MNKRKRMVHDLLKNLESPPPDETLTVAYALRELLRGYADDSVVDSGHGFGESGLDFWLDDKAIRVIIKAVPEMDRPNE